MKKLLLTSALAVAALGSYAQDCAGIVATSGNVKTQVQKVTCTSTGGAVNATMWLSHDADGYYLHIVPVVNADKTPFNIKAKPGERLELVFVTGTVADSRLIKKTGNEAIVTLGSDMVSMLSTVAVENISWFENNATQQSLSLPVSNEAGRKLSEAIGCLK